MGKGKEHSKNLLSLYKVKFDNAIKKYSISFFNYFEVRYGNFYIEKTKYYIRLNKNEDYPGHIMEPRISLQLKFMERLIKRHSIKTTI
jgi:hypothetical protein